MTDLELTPIFRAAYGKYEQEHEARHDTWWEQDAEAAGLRAVADAAERRVLDEFENRVGRMFAFPVIQAVVSGWVYDMREELNRGDG